MNEQEIKQSVEEPSVSEGLDTSTKIVIKILDILAELKPTRMDLNRAFKSVNTTLDQCVVISPPFVHPKYLQDASE